MSRSTASDQGAGPRVEQYLGCQGVGDRPERILIDRIQRALPAEELLECYSNEAEYYGAAHGVATALGMSEAPRARASWTHGLQDPLARPALIQFMHGEHWRDIPHLAINDEEASALRNAGCTQVTVVGMPFLYTRRGEVVREPGSLLVMPVHSMPGWANLWRQDEYADYIASLRNQFSTIVACISPNCVLNHFWYPAFERRGIPWIAGARMGDRNGLERVATILRCFEYVTSNGFGSHLPYAAVSGCKVSLAGPFSQLHADQLRTHEFYREHPQFLDRAVARYAESTVRAQLPHLFATPGEATGNVSWGAAMLNQSSVRSKLEIAELFGWPGFGLSDVMELRREACRRQIRAEYLGRRLSESQYQLRQYEQSPVHNVVKLACSALRWAANLVLQPLRVLYRMAKKHGLTSNGRGKKN